MTTWTESRIETAKTMWAKGHSASQIARAINSASGGVLPVTRNAVVGKLHRLGVEARVIPSRPIRKPGSPPISRRRRPMLAALPGGPKLKASPLPVEIPAPESRGLSITQLKAGVCKFPLGDPKQEGFGFCGCECSVENSYCEFHARIVYRKLVKRERRIDRSKHVGRTLLDVELLEAA